MVVYGHWGTLYLVCSLYALYHILKVHTTQPQRAFICFKVSPCSHHLPLPIKLTFIRAISLMTSTDFRWSQSHLTVPLKTPTASRLIRNSKQRESVNSEEFSPCCLSSVCLSLPGFCSKAAAYQLPTIALKRCPHPTPPPASYRILIGSVRYDSVPCLTAVYQSEKVMRGRQG